MAAYIKSEKPTSANCVGGISDCQKRTSGSQMDFADQPTPCPAYDLDLLEVNPVAPNPPCDFSVVEFAPAEQAAHRIQEADGEWSTLDETPPVRVCGGPNRRQTDK